MENRLHTGALVVLVVGAVFWPAGAGAVERPRDAISETRGQGVDVTFTRDGEGRVAVGRGRGNGSECEWRASRHIDTSIPSDTFGQPPSPDHELWAVWCGTEYAGIVWLGPRDFADFARSLAEQARRRIDMPGVGMDVRPESRGVTGIESYFWVAGYRGDDVSETVSDLGMTVTVTAELAGVKWDFGDGTRTQTGGLGEAWPERSSVRHTYRDPSPDGRPYEVTATLVLQPRWSLDGADQGTLEPIEIEFTRAYEVDQVQAVRRR